MLEARSLTKYYNHSPAVHKVSFAIRPGEILGYLGPNGAGKSTTVKMLTGLIEPSEGQIFYNGRSVYDDFAAFQRRIGYVPEEAHLYPHLTGIEYLQLCGRLRGIERRVLEPKMDEFLRLFDLWSDRHAPLSSYSKGMRQKILLSAALLHDPDILILDEPFSGLDVTSALMLRSLLRRLAGRGKMILYSSHVLEVVEKICSNVLILRKGEVVAYDSIERLRELMSQPSLEGVFSQLAHVDNGDELAGRILDVMGSGEPTTAAAPTPNRPVTFSLRLYRTLASAYPQEFKNAYGSEVVQVTEDSIDSIWRRHGVAGLFRLLADLAIRIPAAHLAELWQDTRYGLRMLAASPGFALVAILSLGLGIAVATAAFSEVNAVFLRTVPGVERPEQLVSVQAPLSYPTYQQFAARRDLFSSAFAYVAPVPFGVTLNGRTERTWGHLVTPAYFSTMGVHPSIGRFFDETNRDRSAVVVSYRFWQNHLGSDPSILGRTLRVNGNPFTVIGVGPRDFLGASPLILYADLWMPAKVESHIVPELAGNTLERRDRRIFHVSGRLQPGVTPERAEAELDTVARQVELAFGEDDKTQKGRRVLLAPGGRVTPLRSQDLPMVTMLPLVLVSLILLIACSNVANMMLARASSRRREIAVRLALGASRARLVRQLLTESMLVALGAGCLGFLLGAWLMRLASGVEVPFPMPVTYDMTVDWKALVFTLAITLCTGLAFGLVPALQATSADLTPALKEGGNVRLRRYRRLSMRNLLVLSQVAGSLSLLLITGFLVLGFQRTTGIDPGFDSKNLAMVSLDPIRDGYTSAQTQDFFQKLLDRVQRLPAVTAATLTDTVPMTMAGFGSATFSVPGNDTSSKVIHNADKYVVGKDYFTTLGIPILFGRNFRKEDEENGATAVIVSESLARSISAPGDPSGRRIEVGNGEVVAPGQNKLSPIGSMDQRPSSIGKGRDVFEVAGVVKDVRRGLGLEKPRASIYFPLRKADFAQPSLQGETLLVRSAPGVDAVALVRREISTMDERLTPFNARTMTDVLAQNLNMVQVAVWMYGSIGVFGLILAAVGLAGVTAYSVAQRTREIGIRMALGAERRDVLGLVMKEGLILVTLGAAIGLALAWACARVLAAFLSAISTTFSTSTSDPSLLVGAPLLLAVLALVACYVPARKSMRVDPVVALRQE